MAFGKARREEESQHEPGFGERKAEGTERAATPEEQRLRVVPEHEEHPSRIDNGISDEERIASRKKVEQERDERPVPLVRPEEASELRERWKSIQTRFVDEPRGAVQEADALVADVLRRITEAFAEERSGLERQWSSSRDVSTEDLRVAMQHYRSFFDRLLSH